MSRVVLLVIDGCAPAYLTRQTAPKLYRLAEQYGFVKQVECAMPSVTNVNHACILSGKWPDETGVTGNYYYCPQTGEEGFIEEKGYMKAPTLLQHYRGMGQKTALFTVKGKILGVYGEGAQIGLSAQQPDSALLDRYGLQPPPSIQSVESTRWILHAAYRCMEADKPDFLYCTTNDCIFHHHAPGEKQALEQVSAIDEYVEKLFLLDPDMQLYLTADHGMNQKTTIVNFQHIAENAGFELFCLPPLKDRYIENHIYQEGGMLYVFLKHRTDAERFARFAGEHPLAGEVLTAAEAAERYHLPQDKIGDYVLLSARGQAFGEVEGEFLHTDESRTHGSLYEREIPLFALNPEREASFYHYSKDIAAGLMNRCATHA